MQTTKKPAGNAALKSRTAFNLRTTTLRDLGALAFVLGKPQGDLVEQGLGLVVSSLARDDKTAFEAARAAREKRTTRT